MNGNLVAVTDRRLCSDLLQQLQRLAQSGVKAVILREKDLQEEAYLQLAYQCREILQPFAVPLVINQQLAVARALGIEQVQLSFPLFADCHAVCKDFAQVWVSVHSKAEALQAAQWGADILIAGHVFATACKPDLAPRGVEFLQQICRAVEIPVYAIGGINSDTYPLLAQSGAAGACVRSQAMRQDKFFWQV